MSVALKIRATAALFLLLLPACLEDGGLSEFRGVEDAPSVRRMDQVRTNPDYRRFIENALVAAAAADTSRKDLAYEAIALAQARLGDIEGALATARNISSQAKWRAPRSRSSSDLPIVLASLQIRAGDVRGARRTPLELGVLPDAGWAPIAFARARTGDIRGAAATIPELDTPALAPAVGYGRFLRMLEAGRVWSAIGNTDKATEVLVQAQRYAEAPGRLPFELAYAAAAWADIGRPERAGELMMQALAAAERPEDLGSDRGLVRVVSALTEIGQIEAARSIAESLRAVDLEARPWSAVQAPALVYRQMLEAIALALADRGEVRAALAGLPPSPYETGFLRHVAARRAEAGDIRGAIAIAERLETGNRRGVDFDGLVVQVAIAAARAEAGQRERAAEGLADATAALDATYHTGRGIALDNSLYALATLWQGIGSAWAKAGNASEARAAFEAAVRTASRLGMTLPFPPVLGQAVGRGRWPDTDLFGAYGSTEPLPRGLSDALAADWLPRHGDWMVSERDLSFLTYVRGFTLRQIACAARAAGVPMPLEMLREAAIAEVDDFRADGSGRSAEGWIVRAVAVALIAWPCPGSAQ